jgi:uncharacterized protein (AIM24 family)
MVLKPDQKIQCEPGTMCYSSNDVQADVKLGGFARVLVDGSLFKNIYKNKGQQLGYVGITANFPATIIPINMDTFGGGGIACKSLCSLHYDYDYTALKYGKSCLH